jgi:hypothetical protein
MTDKVLAEPPMDLRASRRTCPSRAWALFMEIVGEKLAYLSFHEELFSFESGFSLVV